MNKYGAIRMICIYTEGVISQMFVQMYVGEHESLQHVNECNVSNSY